MIKLKNILPLNILLMEDRRREKISADDAANMIFQSGIDINMAYKHNIYRGYDSFANFKDEPSEFLCLYLNPKKEKRTAKQTGNFYNILLENLPSWKDYPHRTESVIGGTTFDVASSYGSSIFKMIPLDKNCKLAVAPGSDMWTSFYRTLSFNLDAFASLIVETCTSIALVLNPDDGPLTSSEIKTLHEKLNKDFDSAMEVLTYIDTNKDALKRVPLRQFDRYDINTFSPLIQKYLSNNLSLFETMDELMTPEKNNFQLVDFYSTNYMSEVGRALREIWTDSPCILLSMNYGNFRTMDPKSEVYDNVNSYISLFFEKYLGYTTND